MPWSPWHRPLTRPPRNTVPGRPWGRLEIVGVGADAVFLRLFSDRGWTCGLDCEVGENRG